MTDIEIEIQGVDPGMNARRLILEKDDIIIILIKSLVAQPVNFSSQFSVTRIERRLAVLGQAFLQPLKLAMHRPAQIGQLAKL